MLNRRTSTISFSFGVLCCCSALAFGAERDDKASATRELATVQDKIKSVQKSVGGLENQKSNLSEQLAKLEIEYGKLANSMRQLEADSRQATQEIDRLRKRKAQITANVLRQNKALAGQARAAYLQGEREWLKILLNHEDGGGSNRVLTYYRYLNKARLNQLRALDQDLTEARELETTTRTLVQQLESTEQQLGEKKARLDDLRSQRQQRLTALERDSRDKNSELLRLKEDAQRLQGLIASLQKASPPVPDSTEPSSNTATPKTHSDWPVSGELRQQFGAPRMSGQWDGVVIAAGEGEPIRAITQGRVAFADWLRGYGLLTIVDHGNGLMSLYGFNQSIQKSVGEWVNAGEVLATVGNSGGQAEPALYFGLRDKGRPIDPLAWRNRNN
jgi:septal ring factor EnvC (AmiA/AmiB activator)